MRIIGCHYAGTTLKAGRSKNADVPQIFALNLFMYNVEKWSNIFEVFNIV